MKPARAIPKVPPTDPELVRAARAAKHGIKWTAETIAKLLGDSLSGDRKSRQARRKEQ